MSDKSVRPTMTSAAPSTSKSRRHTRLLLRTIKLALVAIAILLLAQLLLLPSIVRRQVSQALHGLGLQNVAFDIQSASPWGAEISDIRSTDSDRARINRVSVRYSPFAVMFGHLQSIQIAGADIDVRMKSGVLDLGPLAQLHSSSSSDSASSAGASIPFQRITLLSSVLRLTWDDRQLQLPIQGSLAVTHTGTLDVDISTFFAGSDIPITGTIDSARSSLTLYTASQQIDAPSLLS